MNNITEQNHEVCEVGFTIPIYNNTKTVYGYLHSCVSVSNDGWNSKEWIDSFPVLKSMYDNL